MAWARYPLSERNGKAGLKVADMDVIESNEAFVAQACVCDLGSIREGQPQRSLLGHPVGATGCIIPSSFRIATHQGQIRAGHHVYRGRTGNRRDLRAYLTLANCGRG
jgi:acetyl-CoA acetyltransferase